MSLGERFEKIIVLSSTGKCLKESVLFSWSVERCMGPLFLAGLVNWEEYIGNMNAGTSIGLAPRYYCCDCKLRGE